MKKIPTTLVIHRRTDGVESRIATMSLPFVTNPLEQQLGAIEPGRYRRAEGRDGKSWVYDKSRDMWHEEVESESSDDDAGDLERQVFDDDEEGHGGGDVKTTTTETPTTSLTPHVHRVTQTGPPRRRKQGFSLAILIPLAPRK